MAVPDFAGMDPAKVEFAKQQMKNNPGMMKDAAKKMENLSDSDLEAMNSQLPPGQRMTKEQAKMASSMMSNMSPNS